MSQYDHVMNRVEFAYAGIDEAFPQIDPGVEPFGSRVLVQIRLPKMVTKGGLILTESMRETEHWNTQVAQVRGVGPLAFRNRTTGNAWPEGMWCKIGDFVRVPKYGGDRWAEKISDDDEIIFVLLEDHNVLGRITGNPLTVKAFL